MKEIIRIVSKKVLADNWCKLTEYIFDLKRRDGTWQRVSREVYARGTIVVCLLHNPENDHVLLIRQFRLPSFLIDRGGHVIEAPAGILDDINPEMRMQMELEEETGFRVTKLEKLYDLMMSPGSLDENAVFFTGTFCARDQVSDGGGLKDEGEDIEVLEMSLDQALKMIETGEIYDAKTVILLQHLALQRL